MSYNVDSTGITIIILDADDMDVDNVDDIVPCGHRVSVKQDVIPRGLQCKLARSLISGPLVKSDTMKLLKCEIRGGGKGTVR